jgi:hypothetical protein
MPGAPPFQAGFAAGFVTGFLAGFLTPLAICLRPQSAFYPTGIKGVLAGTQRIDAPFRKPDRARRDQHGRNGHPVR